MRLKSKLGAAAVVPLALGAAGEAQADVGGQPVDVAPAPAPTPKPGQMTTQTVTPGAYVCNSSGTMRRAANSYVIGWCMGGTRIDVSSTGAPSGYQSAYGYGNYAFCGWFDTNTHPPTSGGTYANACNNKSFAESYFANAINAGSTTDGDQVSVLKNCTRYANVRPWDGSSSNTTGHDSVGTLDASTMVFKWRYRSKNDFWVLGRATYTNPATPQPYYDWAFVQRDCVGTPATRAPTDVVPS